MRRKVRDREPWLQEDQIYREMWESLEPRERLRRAWRMRGRLKNAKAIHDAKTFREV
jgi:hypothetical protein